MFSTRGRSMRRTGLSFGVYVLLCAGFLRPQGKLEEAHVKKEVSSQRRQEVASTSTPCCIYDRNPNHIWNRLFRLFYVRTGKNLATLGSASESQMTCLHRS
jgi:hypothetical protein